VGSRTARPSCGGGGDEQGLGSELNGEARDDDEWTFKELLHSEVAEVDDTLGVLTRRSRSILVLAAGTRRRRYESS